MNIVNYNFSRAEMSCFCGCGFDTADVELLEVMEVAREIIGPFIPNSVCRCLEYNEVVKRVANGNYVPFSSKSKHLLGIACDIPCKTPEIAKDLYEYLEIIYPNKYGMGKYSWGVHIDVRTNKVRW